MAKYVMANRRATKFHYDEKRFSRAKLDEFFRTNIEKNVNVVGERTPADDSERRVIVFEGDEKEISCKVKNMHKDVMIEREALRYPAVLTPKDLYPTIPLEGIKKPNGDIERNLKVVIRGNGKGLEGVQTILYLKKDSTNTTMNSTSTTSPLGHVSFDFENEWTPAALVVVPPGSFWSIMVQALSDEMSIDLPPLPRNASPWWHQVMGIDGKSGPLGTSIRIGVLDTGVGPHPDLSHVVNVGAFIDGTQRKNPFDGVDVGTHGTHVCGIIGAHGPSGADGVTGIAQGAELFAARVFAQADSGANQGDIANGIDYMSKTLCADLINLSLSSETRSEIEYDAIIDAYERGTLCVCASANYGATPVEYPARFDETVAIGAIGVREWGPLTSLARLNLPQNSDKFGDGDFYLANFSNYGKKLNCVAPGVGIISTVPARSGLMAPYADMSGTSMASPAACGALATLLSSSESYMKLERNTTRSEFAKQTLVEKCRDIGLDEKFQGKGLLTV